MAPIRPFRCFNPRILLVALVASAILIGLAWWARTLPVGSPPRILAAIGQVVALGWLLFEMVVAIRRLDELEQRIHSEALAFSATAIVLVVGGWRFLERAGLPAVDWSEYALPLLSISWALSVTWISRRFR